MYYLKVCYYIYNIRNIWKILPLLIFNLNPLVSNNMFWMIQILLTYWEGFMDQNIVYFGKYFAYTCKKNVFSDFVENIL